MKSYLYEKKRSPDTLVIKLQEVQDLIANLASNIYDIYLNKKSVYRIAESEFDYEGHRKDILKQFQIVKTKMTSLAQAVKTITPIKENVLHYNSEAITCIRMLEKHQSPRNISNRDYQVGGDYDNRNIYDLISKIQEQADIDNNQKWVQAAKEFEEKREEALTQFNPIYEKFQKMKKLIQTRKR